MVPAANEQSETCFACCAQMWVLAAQFEVRQLRLDAARKILGMAIGMAPKVRAAAENTATVLCEVRSAASWCALLLSKNRSAHQDVA